LLRGHSNWVLVGISVQSNFMTCFDNHPSLLWKGFYRVTWSKPSSFKIIFLKQVKQTRYPHFTRKKAPRNIIGRIFTAIGTQPTCHCINIYPIGNQNFFFTHFIFPLSFLELNQKVSNLLFQNSCTTNCTHIVSNI